MKYTKLHKTLSIAVVRVDVAMLGVLRLLIVSNNRFASVVVRRHHAHHTPSKFTRRMMTTPAPQVIARFDIPQTLLVAITDNY